MILWNVLFSLGFVFIFVMIVAFQGRYNLKSWVVVFLMGALMIPFAGLYWKGINVARELQPVSAKFVEVGMACQPAPGKKLICPLGQVDHLLSERDRILSKNFCLGVTWKIKQTNGATGRFVSADKVPLCRPW